MRKFCLFIICAFISFALSCSDDKQPAPADWAKRCRDIKSGFEIKLGPTEFYCVHNIGQALSNADPDDPTNTGGGVGICKNLGETPHHHHLPETQAGICSSQATMGREKVDIIIDRLQGTDYEPTIPVNLPDMGLPDMSDDMSQDMPSDMPEDMSTPVCKFGNGLYCGTTLGLDEGTLYRCDDAIIKIEEVCENSCSIQPEGMHDQCVKCPSGDGLYCGNALGESKDQLFRCTDGIYTLEQACSTGCAQQMVGMNDICAPSGSCTPQEEGMILNLGPWSSCDYNTPCAQRGIRERVNAICRNGQIVPDVETDMLSCGRNTNDLIISEGAWKTCEYSNPCDENGSRSRTNTICRDGTTLMEQDQELCTRSTQGNTCGEQSICQQAQCVSTICTPSVDSISPLSATLDKVTTFTITGQCLPNTTAAWIAQCVGSHTSLPVSVNANKTSATFECKPSYSKGRKTGVIKDKPMGNVLLDFTVDIQ